ncbi:hypothetical protein PRZ48_002332 [Zasmidium cellare]|uniref:Polyketide synthase n=1 Tax=Zasmidium cellare TaxID=395010 RepID=A0ABR0F564_ZASCE|nr:hypothetical protein PRZ48_002332 [Zasmidium cellare]
MAPHFTERTSSTSSNDDGYASGPVGDGGAEPIAICGLGEVYSASDLWNLLLEDRTGQCDVPSSRFNIDAFYHPRGPDRPGSMNVKGGYFLQDDVRLFENDFFGINNKEATWMDPQQRKLLEVVFECFESAGVPLEKASGSNIGCYVGNFTVDFVAMQNRDAENFQRYSIMGIGATILGNRISHTFNLTGPSLVIDTACSSSLYCLHMACRALEAGECDAAVVAGANLIQSVEQHLATMKAGVLSPTSQCHTFDASADGYGRADGIGALYLKRLSDAVAAGDPIRAVVRGTAINANGKTQGISLPSAVAQEAVIRKAYAKAGLDLDGTAYVECHGTGTPVGDPIEVEAVARAFANPSRDPLLIGSVKTNIGHSEAASGISSIIKVALALESGFIPPTHGVKKLNPKIKSKEWGVEVVTEGRQWPQSSGVRRAGVNSFGYGGANAHSIIESYEASKEECRSLIGNRTRYLLPFSASKAESLQARVADLLPSLGANVSIEDLVYTLATRRSQLPQKGFAVASKTSLSDDLISTAIRTVQDPTGVLPLAFVFTGQGAQWAGMGKELLDEFEVFDEAFNKMDEVLQSLPHAPEWRLKDVLREPAETSKINEVEYSQPLCTALQIGIIHLLQSWDIRPAVVVGHSSGEIAAAYAAGRLNLSQALAAAYYRGYVVKNFSKSPGAMMAAGMSRGAGDELISSLDLHGRVRVACMNSPESITLSGHLDAIEELQRVLDERKALARKLKTGGTAYHSHHMRVLGDRYQSLLEPVFGAASKSKRLQSEAVFVSSVTGEQYQDSTGPEYWRANLESPVDFTTAVTTICGMDRFHFVELGPHSALEMPLKQIVAASGGSMPYTSAITRNKNAITTVLTLAGILHLHGHAIDLLHVNGLDAPRTVSSKGIKGPRYKVLPDLPPYHWTYDGLLWHEPRSSVEFRLRPYPRHELLGSRIPGGFDAEGVWRNLLRVEEISWLEDHKLQETTVFPGAGYLALAVEAALQMKKLHPQAFGHRISIKDVGITNALVLKAGVAAEIFTTMRPRMISNVTASKDCWDFSIFSSIQGSSTMHARGLITISESTETMTMDQAATVGALEDTAPRTWYERMRQICLNFGPQFRSISNFQVPRMNFLRHCTSNVSLLRQSEGDPGPTYVVHPITLDAMLQTAIVSTAAGSTTALRAKVPTRIGRVDLDMTDVNGATDWTINGKSKVVGFGAANVSAELVLQREKCIARMIDVRVAPYEAVSHVDTKEAKHPVLRVQWKPDLYGLGLMKPAGLSSFLEAFVNESQGAIRDEGLLKLEGALSLAAHKNPRAHILELGNSDHGLTHAMLRLLSAQHAFKKLRSYSTAAYDEQGVLQGSVVDLATGERGQASKLDANQQFDLVLLPDIHTADAMLTQNSEEVKKLLSGNGLLIACSTQSEQLAALSEDFEVITSAFSTMIGSIVVGRRLPSMSSRVAGPPVILLEREVTPLGDVLTSKLLQHLEIDVARCSASSLSEETMPAGAVVIATIETTKPFLATQTTEDMALMKLLTDRASTMIWLTAGDLLAGHRPELALSSGLARAIMFEQPSLRFINYDIDNIDVHTDTTAENIVSVVQQADALNDFEFVQKDGIVHISRFVPDDKINHSFRTQQGLEAESMSLRAAGPVQIGIETPGKFDAIYWTQIQIPHALAPSDVQVSVKALGVNAKDVYALGGKLDTPDAACSLECCGVVERVGSAVSHVQPGDRVVVMAPGHFRTTEIVPEMAVKKLLECEDFNTMCTLSVVYTTALYTLRDLARIQPGETVLIHSAAGGVGIAAIQIAKMLGAKVFGTVSSPDKATHLIQTFGLSPQNIFSSRDTSFATDIHRATNGRGVDVVLNSLTGDLLHASWACCAPFGRFIEIGKRDLTDSGRLDMQQFLNNVSFSVFDLTGLYASEMEAHRMKLSALMEDVLELYRAGEIGGIEPLEVFGVEDMEKALRRFGSRNRIGKIAINFEDQDAVLDVRPFKYRATFSPEKSYLMIGCLGGIGRSLSKWMMARGARRFVFLGRSGLDKASARDLVQELKNLGASVEVVRGDVTKLADVEAVVERADSPIGGVIQAAMGLDEALFSAMSNESWHTAIDPKVTGTWNLHNAIKGRDSELDFFLMTSSVSGAVGTATESNYCAANAFLDSFARHRRSLGLPATAVGLGMINEVGYLHENPDIEALLLRKGILPINEDEMLQIIDLALSSQFSMPHAYDEAAESHMLTGLEPLGILELRKQGFKISNLALEDPRSSILASALGDETDSSVNQSNALPREVSSDLEAGMELKAAIRKHISQRFCDLVLMEPSKVDTSKPLSAYGIDSMLAAEFRTWFFKAFKVDVPFLELLSEMVSLESLSGIVVEEIEVRGRG